MNVQGTFCHYRQFSVLNRICIDKNVFVYRQELFCASVSSYNLSTVTSVSIDSKSNNPWECTLDTGWTEVIFPLKIYIYLPASYD